MSNVTVLQQNELPAPMTAVTPMAMLSQAVAAGADIVVLEKLMGLSERWEANQARKAFDEAIASAKAEIPPIGRNAEGHNKKKYADFSAIAKVIDPIISKHGLSYRFRTKQDERINVTCIISHKAGHSEETTLAGPADMTGNKNAIQAIGSTLTYLQRYSLVQALGLAAANDDDATAATNVGDTITQKQADEIIDLLEEVGGNRQVFLKYFKVAAVEQIPAKEYDRVIQSLNAKRTPQ